MLHGVESETVGFGDVGEPSNLPEKHLVDVFIKGVAHIEDAITKPPCGISAIGVAGVNAGVGEGFGCLACIVLPIGICIVPIELPVTRTGVVYSISGVIKGFFVRKSVNRIPDEIRSEWEVVVEVEVCLPWMTNAAPLGVVLALCGVIWVEAGVGIFLRDVPAKRIAIENLPFVLIVD